MDIRSNVIPTRECQQKRKNLLNSSFDFGLLLPVLLLIGIGCFFIFDFTVVDNEVYDKNYYFVRQIIFAIGGILCMYFISRIDYHSLEALFIPSVIVIILINLCYHLSDSLGVIQLGNQYLKIGPVILNVGTLTELISCVVIAKLLITKATPVKKTLIVGTFVIFISAMLLLLPDYKSTTLFLCVVAIMLFINSKHFIFCAISVSVVTLIASVTVISGDIVDHRILAWMDPFADPNGSGYYVIQSLYSIAEGGFWGVGIGEGTLRYSIGNAHSFSILPAIVQETGLLGASIILLLFLFFIFRSIKIAINATDKGGFYLTTVIIVRFGTMLIMNLLVHTNLMPTIYNLRFPFLSYGGTELMLDCFLVGILLSVARYQFEAGRR